MFVDTHLIVDFYAGMEAEVSHIVSLVTSPRVKFRIGLSLNLNCMFPQLNVPLTGSIKLQNPILVPASSDLTLGANCHRLGFWEADYEIEFNRQDVY